MSRIVALDQSLTQTGCAVAELIEGKWIWIDRAVFKPKSKGIHRFAEIREWLKYVLDRNKPVRLSRELHNHAIYGNANALHALNGIIDLIAYDAGYIQSQAYLTIPVGLWKKFCLGKGNVAKDTGYLLTVNKFLKKIHHIVEKEEFVDVTNDNIADAMCMANAVIAIDYMKNRQHSMLTRSEFDALKGWERCFDYGGDD